MYWGYHVKVTIQSKRNHFSSSIIPFSYDGALFDLITEGKGTYLYDEGSVFENWAAVQGGVARIVSTVEIILKDSIFRNLYVI